MTEHFEPTRFTRHNRFIHALILESQAWFSLTDLGRLMGRPLDERLARKLDSDQRRVLWLNYHGKIQETLMVSESGVYALMVHHHIPENQSLRQWLTHEVIPALRNIQTSIPDQGPSLSSLHWAGHAVSLLHWQNEAWVRWRDMPGLIQPTEKMPV
ncbi:Bro-N domain-containing protein [Pseudomonas sp. MWU12-2345]|uniref:BRO-N domain-containing protein n=1 Tax=Pseudomonas sp. MWU12-2345 TaxID=2928689 RepID=UPI00200F01C6|nr:Bro-N domain-containing protein [Pseudomonas sp. MWU12-2345]